MQILSKKYKEEEKPEPIKSPDRDLEPSEISFEEKAVRLPKGKFARILPIPGTLGYYLRDIVGGNATIMEFIKIGLKESQGPKGVKLRKIVHVWEIFDLDSRNRVDVFDWLCKKFDLPVYKFYGVVAEGMCKHHDIMTARVLMESKSEVVSNVRKFAKKEKNFRDRELLAKATGVAKDVPLIGSINNSTQVTNNNLTLESSGFKNLINRTDRMIDEDIVEGEIIEEDLETKPRQLTEGQTQFISAKDKLFNEEELLQELER